MFTPNRDAAALAGTRRGTPMPGNNTQRGPRQFAAVSANAPWSGAPGANHADSNSAATASMPRRPVRSAQANFSAAAPQPHLDNSQDAVNAAVLPPGASPGFAVFSQSADWPAPTSRPGPWHDLQLLNDLTKMDTGDRILAPKSSSPPTQIMSEAQRPPGKTEGDSAALEQEGAAVLPGGSTVPDPHSATGRMLSPVADLSPVAVAGRQTGQMYRTLLRSPTGSGGALPYLAVTTLSNVGQGGAFDYQRQGNRLTGFTQLPQYRDVSNFNVGLFCQQAGLSLDETLTAAGRFAGIFSSNAKLDQPYGLDQQTAEFIKVGYKVGRSGVFDPAPRR
jgi:hypothetical protein